MPKTANVDGSGAAAEETTVKSRGLTDIGP